MTYSITITDETVNDFDTVTVSETAEPTYDRDTSQLTAAYPSSDEEKEYVFTTYRYGDDDLEVEDGSKVVDYGSGVAYVLVPIDAYEGGE